VDRKSLILFVGGGLLLALALAFFVSPRASSSPDGLNKVAQDQGFMDEEQRSAAADGPLAGYGVKGVEDDSLSTGLSGVIGVVATFGIGMLAFGGMRLMRQRRDAKPEKSTA
jgi:hypothetical protein